MLYDCSRQAYKTWFEKLEARWERGGRKYSQLLHLVQVAMTYQVGVLFIKEIVFCYEKFIYAFSFLVLPFSECKGVVKKPWYINLFLI